MKSFVQATAVQNTKVWRVANAMMYVHTLMIAALIMLPSVFKPLFPVVVTVAVNMIQWLCANVMMFAKAMVTVVMILLTNVSTRVTLHPV
jgi:hypothetical protein